MAPWIKKIADLLSNPEVMKKVCDVLPELADDFKEISLSYPDLVKESEKLNQKNMDAYNEMCKIVLDELQKILDTGETSAEERKYLIDKMFEILNKQSDSHIKNREATADNIRMVGEFLLLGPFGLVPEAIIRKRNQKQIQNKK